MLLVELRKIVRGVYCGYYYIVNQIALVSMVNKKEKTKSNFTYQSYAGPSEAVLPE